jgi:CheY-like chemotaxis protein
VETNEDDGLLLETAMNSKFVEITLVKTICEALDLSKKKNFNLILLETRFPDGDGFNLCRQIREDLPQIPVIFYSGDAAEKDKQLGLESGAEVYLTKPYFDTLTTTVNQYIGLYA